MSVELASLAGIELSGALTEELYIAISAVVSRGGHPDLAGPRPGRVDTSTLLIVGGADPKVLALNRRARAELKGVCRPRRPDRPDR